jgi:hypothetical protein
MTVEGATVPSDEDKKKMVSLAVVLDSLQKQTDTYRSSAVSLLSRLTEFQSTLRNTLQPIGEQMLDRLTALDLAKETQMLQKDIAQMKDQIKALQAEYDKDVGLAFTGAAGMVFPVIGIITWSVTGGVYGAKAERARKDKEDLQKKLDAKVTLYNNLNTVSAFVHKATSSIADLELALTNAIVGLNSLVTVWGSVKQYVESAAAALRELNSKSDLIEFSIDLSAAGDAWNAAPDITTGLLKLFNEAHRQVDQPVALTAGAASDPDDLEIWNDNYVTLSNILINEQSSYVPTLEAKAANLRSDAVSVYDAVTSRLVILRGADTRLAESAADVEQYAKYADKLKENPNDQNAAAWCTRILDNFAKNADAFKSKLSDLSHDIRGNTEVLAANTRTDLASTGFYAQLNNECKRFDGVIKSHTELMLNNFVAPMLQLEEELKKLDSDIAKKLDPENVLNGFKEFLPSSQAVSDMLTDGEKSPEIKEIEAIKIVYDMALKGLDVIGAAISLCSKIEERVKLNEELATLRQGYEQCRDHLLELQDNQHDLLNLVRMQTPLLFFAQNGERTAAYIDTVCERLAACATKNDLSGFRAILKSFVAGTPISEILTVPLHSGKSAISIMPEVSRAFRPLDETALPGDAASSSISYQQGYGQLSKAGATVQSGVTGHISVNLKISSFSEEYYETSTKELTDTLTKETIDKMEEHRRNCDYSSWWFTFLAGCDGRHDSDYYKNQQSTSVSIADTKVFSAVTKNMSSCKTDYEVRGEFDIVGQGFTPTTVFLFIETLTVRTSDGMTVIVPTTNTAVADEHGNTGVGTSGGKLNIVPLS